MMNDKYLPNSNTFAQMASKIILNKTELSRECLYENDLWLRKMDLNNNIQYIHCKDSLLETIYGNIYKGILIDSNDINDYFKYGHNQNDDNNGIVAPLNSDDRSSKENVQDPSSISTNHHSPTNEPTRITIGKQVIIKSFHRISVEQKKHYRNHMNIQENPYQEMETILTLNEQQFQHVPILHGIWLSNEWFYCILEDCGIDLYEYTNNLLYSTPTSTKKLKKQSIQMIFHQLISIIVELYEKHHLSHGDLSLENICINPNTGIIKIIDFGLCKKAYLGGIQLSKLINETSIMDNFSRTGKYIYMSPEKYYATHAKGFNSIQNDVWSLGIVLYILCTQRIPYNDPMKMDFLSLMNILQNIHIVDHHMHYKQLKEIIGDNGIDLLQQMLHCTTYKRIALCDILQHDYFCKG